MLHIEGHIFSNDKRKQGIKSLHKARLSYVGEKKKENVFITRHAAC